MTDEQLKQLDAAVLAALERLGKGGAQWMQVDRITKDLPYPRWEVRTSLHRLTMAGEIEEKPSPQFGGKSIIYLYRIAPAGGKKH